MAILAQFSFVQNKKFDLILTDLKQVSDRIFRYVNIQHKYNFLHEKCYTNFYPKWDTMDLILPRSATWTWASLFMFPIFSSNH